MRKISILQVVLFFSMLGLVVVLGVGTVWLLLGDLALGDFRGVILVVTGVALLYLWSFLVYRIFLFVLPLQVGELAEGGRGEFAAQVHFLFFLFLFNSLVRSHVLPIPLMRVVYLALGARLGSNTYSAGAILDPALVEIGANCVVGHDAVLFCHVIEGRRLALAPIRIDDEVTIGASVVVMPGVEIGKGAIVSAGAVVSKGSRIPAGEVWGGVPARRLR